MKPRNKLVAALTGLWLLFVLIDGAMGVIRGWYTLKMAKPVRVGYRLTGGVRSLLMFGIVALTAGLAYFTKQEESCCGK